MLFYIALNFRSTLIFHIRINKTKMDYKLANEPITEE